MITQLLLCYPSFCLEAENKIKILERTNFKKKVSVENLTNEVDGKLKNYRTFSITLSEILVFCHIANDGSEPLVICH